MTMERTIVKTPEAPLPIGPYNQAVAATGRMIFLAGQIAIDPTTNTLIDGDVRAQTRRVCLNIGAVLKAAGTSFAGVVKTTVFLKDMNDFVAMNEVYGEFFAAASPARSTVQVSRLPKDCSIEIEVIAVV